MAGFLFSKNDHSYCKNNNNGHRIKNAHPRESRNIIIEIIIRIVTLRYVYICTTAPWAMCPFSTFVVKTALITNYDLPHNHQPSLSNFYLPLRVSEPLLSHKFVGQSASNCKHYCHINPATLAQSNCHCCHKRWTDSSAYSPT